MGQGQRAREGAAVRGSAKEVAEHSGSLPWWHDDGDLPERVTVGHYIAEIVVVSLESDYGNAHDRPCRIQLDGAQTYYQAAETLLHEIMHFVYWTTGARHLPGEQDMDAIEEFMVTRISSTLAVLMRDDPAVVQWVMKGLADGPVP